MTARLLASVVLIAFVAGSTAFAQSIFDRGSQFTVSQGKETRSLKVLDDPLLLKTEMAKAFKAIGDGRPYQSRYVAVVADSNGQKRVKIINDVAKRVVTSVFYIERADNAEFALRFGRAFRILKRHCYETGKDLVGRAEPLNPNLKKQVRHAFIGTCQ